MTLPGGYLNACWRTSKWDKQESEKTGAPPVFS
jgi:hypothetical protein